VYAKDIQLLRTRMHWVSFPNILEVRINNRLSVRLHVYVYYMRMQKRAHCKYKPSEYSCVYPLFSAGKSLYLQYDGEKHTILFHAAWNNMTDRQTDRRTFSRADAVKITWGDHRAHSSINHIDILHAEYQYGLSNCVPCDHLKWFLLHQLY